MLRLKKIVKFENLWDSALCLLMAVYDLFSCAGHVATYLSFIN